MSRFTTALLAALLIAGCGGDDDTLEPDASMDAAMDGAPPTTFGGARPATLLVPDSYVAGTPVPLVISLHGYGTFGRYVNMLLQLETLHESEGFLLIEPLGSLDVAPDPSYYWDATDACCNFYGNDVDDVAYLNGLVDEIEGAYDVDPDRIYVIGHSNGGFMAYRLACESDGRFAAIVSLAGATYTDAASCTPGEPVSVLQVHGTADATIEYLGGTLEVEGAPVPYPSAATSVAQWATLDGCGSTTAAGAPLDLVDPAGDDTTVLTYSGCPAGVGVELWTLPDAGHLVIPHDPSSIWAWLEAHPRP